MLRERDDVRDVVCDGVRGGIIGRRALTVASVIEQNHLESREPVDVTAVAPHPRVAARPRVQHDRETVADGVVGEPEGVVLEVVQDQLGPSVPPLEPACEGRGSLSSTKRT